MCMVGQLQWAVTLGRYDILAHAMSLSRFRLAPKVGHIERMKRIYGYLSRTKHYALKTVHYYEISSDEEEGKARRPEKT